MGASSSQQGTSAGSGTVINNFSKCTIDNFIQNNNSRTSTSTSSAKVEIDYCPAPVCTFLGRSKELEKLKALFTQHQVIALVGMGGLGKTQLSRKYVLVNKANYQYKYWLESETPEKLEKSFKKLASKLHVESDNIDDEVVNDVYKKMQAVPTILVFDNVEKPEHVYAYLPTRVDLPPGVTIHVLVTSRWTDWTCDEQIECYKLQPLDTSASVQILKRKFDETGIETMINEWEELGKMLGYLPLALQVAASYIHRLYKHNPDLRTVLTDYMEQLREGAGKLLNDLLTEYGYRSVYASMLLTLQQLENKADDEWQLAVTLINAAAYTDPDKIEKECLLKLLDKGDSSYLLDEALVILTEFSLFDQVVESSGNIYYTVHRIIQISIRHNQTVKKTADMYYIRALKYAYAGHYIFPTDVLQYANERASAVVEYYNLNPSPTLLIYLVRYNAITAVQAVFKPMTGNQIQCLIKQHGLLHCAVRNEYLPMAQLLYDYGADIDQLNRADGNPTLHWVCWRGNMDIAKWLLQNSFTSTERDGKGRTALHVAIMYARHEIVSDVIQTDRDAVHVTDDTGNTPLLTIDYSNNEEDILSTIRVLVENDADITAVDKEGNSVLHSAARGACAAAVSLILQLNKDLINIINKDGNTALHVIPYYSTYADDESSLSTMRVLVENGVDLTQVDIMGNSVLHSAARYARVAALSLFLQVNKDGINIVNKEGQTALHVIPYFCTDIDDERFLSTMRVLVEGGADVTKVDLCGNTVLHSAAEGANATAVSFILQLNKDLINNVNEEGQTALHVLGTHLVLIFRNRCIEGIKETARVLIMNGLSLDTRDKEGRTPLDTVLRKYNNTLLQVADECNTTAQPNSRSVLY